LSIRAIQKRAEAELKIRRSRFIGCALPIDDPRSFRERIAELQALYPGANHYCYALRSRYPLSEEHSSDDGEPSGTAGRPILNQMKRREIDQGLLVVVRYFGGIKLGVPGLIEAYGETARAVLELAPLENLVLKSRYRVFLPYGEAGRLRGELARLADLSVESETFEGEGVSLVCAIPRDREGELEERLHAWGAMGRLSRYLPLP
jgi:putative IMPACT (imprinted ancient) family translation regulator